MTSVIDVCFSCSNWMLTKSLLNGLLLANLTGRRLGSRKLWLGMFSCLTQSLQWQKMVNVSNSLYFDVCFAFYINNRTNKKKKNLSWDPSKKWQIEIQTDRPKRKTDIQTKTSPASVDDVRQTDRYTFFCQKKKNEKKTSLLHHSRTTPPLSP